MLKKKCLLFSLIAAVLVLSALTLCSMSSAQEIHKDAGYYNERGMDCFNRGFYDLLSKNRGEEAAQEFEQAVTAFKQAIVINKNNIQAHRNLARTYYAQKKYLMAAGQYRKVTDLNPSDIDAYVIAALAWTKMQQYAEAIEQLLLARTFTSDKAVIRKLDEYISKINQAKSPE